MANHLQHHNIHLYMTILSYKQHGNHVYIAYPTSRAIYGFFRRKGSPEADKKKKETENLEQRYLASAFLYFITWSCELYTLYHTWSRELYTIYHILPEILIQATRIHSRGPFWTPSHQKIVPSKCVYRIHFYFC